MKKLGQKFRVAVIGLLLVAVGGSVAACRHTKAAVVEPDPDQNLASDQIINTVVEHLPDTVWQFDREKHWQGCTVPDCDRHSYYLKDHVWADDACQVCGAVNQDVTKNPERNPAENHATADNPSENKPAADQTTEDIPAENKPAEDEPAETTPPVSNPETPPETPPEVSPETPPAVSPEVPPENVPEIPEPEPTPTTTTVTITYQFTCGSSTKQGTFAYEQVGTVVDCAAREQALKTYLTARWFLYSEQDIAAIVWSDDSEAVCRVDLAAGVALRFCSVMWSLRDNPDNCDFIGNDLSGEYICRKDALLTGTVLSYLESLVLAKAELPAAQYGCVWYTVDTAAKQQMITADYCLPSTHNLVCVVQSRSSDYNGNGD